MQTTTPQLQAPVDAFLARNGLTLEATVVEVFHAVRRIPYGSGSTRDVAQVVQRNEGSCSGKHLLLREILRRQKQEASIETVKGDFTSKLTPHETMPQELKQICTDGGITDYHHYVVWHGPDGEQKLDATWSDGPISHGLLGNQNWNGMGDTDIALTPVAVLDRVEDLVPYKVKLLEQLSEADKRRRLRFLSLLTDWAAKTELEGETQ